MSPLQLLDDEIDDTGSGCVICMCEVRDTLILPCLCIICLICLCLYSISYMCYMSLLQLLDDEIDDTGSECVICMCEVRDTLILPCRHLCLCNGCADNLRYQANNCPICRSPFRALLQIRAMRKKMPNSPPPVSMSSLYKAQLSSTGNYVLRYNMPNSPPSYTYVLHYIRLNSPPPVNLSYFIQENTRSRSRVALMLIRHCRWWANIEPCFAIM